MPDKRLINNVITFGCRLNASESESIMEIAADAGLEGFTIINTCAVTAEAERKLRQTIRKLYSENKNVKIILTGCASQLHADSYLKMDGVVGIIPNDKKLLLQEYQKYLHKQDNDVSYGSSGDSRDGSAKQSLSTSVMASASVSLDLQKRPQKVRGFLQIQNGCDQRCTYCVVRITRGRNVSYASDDILRLARNMIHKGYAEVVLTGVNITSYGRDKGTDSKLAFLIHYLLQNIPELKRLRLSSLDPADIDQNLLDVIGGEERLMPHIHESIQSGDNMILRRMMRRHSREQVIEINKKIAAIRPETIFGADFIVGFPTETDEMFANSVGLLAEANLTLSHVFPFSARPGTPAALMPQVSGTIISTRSEELRSRSRAVLDQKLSEFVGNSVHVLAENATNAKTDSFLKAKSMNTMIAGKIYKFECLLVDKGTMVGIAKEMVC
ncbi:MAG: tRNA (N(6)-L-threonylcarbamoyladenosine(37)-C(2))-methylthiotransferase MtaB [Holosporaceae bacterium]|jgi:threonylcarbamoyladenosine tRNA methylthiotransferase MtaB|nr:tRNA (N(6)-L-threonylcarbamoyladenosine(37)-C(2))-methylthiotransferase MtaB [Holosporaceae bacterium]